MISKNLVVQAAGSWLLLLFFKKSGETCYFIYIWWKRLLNTINCLLMKYSLAENTMQI